VFKGGRQRDRDGHFQGWPFTSRMDGLTFSDIQCEITTGGSKGSRTKRDIDMHKDILDEAWAAISRWILTTMRQRKGVHIPSLCKITWEFMSGPSNEVRVRPVFILTEAFIRGLRLASFRKPELPSNCAACEDLNLSQVSIKYSETLTKDVLFVAVRDIVRKISEHVASGHSLNVALEVGKLCAKGRRVWFDFDASAFADMGSAGSSNAGPALSGEASPSLVPALQLTTKNQGEAPPSVRQKPREHEQRLSARSAARLSTASHPEQQSGREEEEDSGQGQGFTEGPAELDQEETRAEQRLSHEDYQGEGEGGYTRDYEGQGESGGEGQGEDYGESGGGGGGEGEESDDPIKRALIGRGGDACLEHAFARYLGEMEADALNNERLQASITKRQAQVYGEADRRRDEHKRQVVELQDSIKTQMAEKKAERARDVQGLETELHHADLPILTRDAGVAEALNATPAPEEVDEGMLTPRSLMVHRMRNTITDGGVRGRRPEGISQGQLLASLQGQIGAKSSLRKHRKESSMHEERRYLEHVKAEMHLHSTYSQASELSKQRDLLAAWERDGHLKNLHKLKPLGTQAMKEYVAEVVHTAASQGSGSQGSSGGGGEGKKKGGRSTFRESMASARGGKGVGVGFDPRAAT